MALTTFMAITHPDIQGPSIAAGHDHEFELHSYSYSAVFNPANGRTTLTPVTITMAAFAGPLLLSSLAAQNSADRLHTITIGTYKPSPKTGKEVLFEKIELVEAFLTLYQESNSAGANDNVVEISFEYREFRLTQGSDNTEFIFDNRQF